MQCRLDVYNFMIFLVVRFNIIAAYVLIATGIHNGIYQLLAIGNLRKGEYICALAVGSLLFHILHWWGYF